MGSMLLSVAFVSAQKMYDATHKLPTQSASINNMIYEGDSTLFHDESMNSVYWGGRKTGLAVYVPPQYYTEPNRRFPVLYYMHGQGGGATLDGADGKIAGEIHKRIAAGTIEPFIYVMPSGGPLQFSGPSEEFVIKEVIPFMDESYRTYPYPEQRAIMGFSMGGAVSTRLGVVYKELLSSLCLFKSATLADTIGNCDFMRYVYDVHGPRYNDDPNPVLSVNGTEDGFDERWNFQYLKDKYEIDFDTLAVVGCGHNDNCCVTNSGTEILSFTTENFVRVIKQSTNSGCDHHNDSGIRDFCRSV